MVVREVPSQHVHLIWHAAVFHSIDEVSLKCPTHANTLKLNSMSEVCGLVANYNQKYTKGCGSIILAYTVNVKHNQV